jgi:LCP family protein required for cell wall assembly
VIVVASAATTAVFVSGEVGTLRSALSQNPSLTVAPGSLASTGFGGPETLLLVGDDQRALTRYYHHAVLPHSNEMLLVRLDPAKPWISMLSIPRDLKVTIYPPHASPVTTRFNYAYTAGGIPTLLSTIKRVLGLSVNHVVVITFGRFKRAVDEMGCVYSTVDRRYYHSNVGSVEQYQEINLQPGYQRLCGTQSLQFVSYRHGDTALIRDARNQSFLLDVKKQYGPTLGSNVHKFEHIFGRAVQTDPALHTTRGILDLLGTLISSSARRVRQVQFQANLLPNEVTASPQQISASVHSFLHGGQALPPRPAPAPAPPRARRGPQLKSPQPLTPSTATEMAAARRLAAKVPFPLEYPRVRAQQGNADPVQLRDYLIHAPDGAGYPAFVAVMSAGQLGQFYDVQGTSWTTAPQFDSPDQTVRIGRRTYYLYYEGQHLKMVAWYEHSAVYWIRNTLLSSIANGTLMAIARQTSPVPGARGLHPRPGHPIVVATAPVRTKAVAKTSLKLTLGSVSAFVALLGAPLLALLLLRRRRQLSELRAQLQSTRALEERLAAAADRAAAAVAANRAPGAPGGATPDGGYGPGSPPTSSAPRGAPSTSIV